MYMYMYIYIYLYPEPKPKVGTTTKTKSNIIPTVIILGGNSGVLVIKICPILVILSLTKCNQNKEKSIWEHKKKREVHYVHEQKY